MHVVGTTPQVVNGHVPDLPYFPRAPVFRPLSPVSRTEAKNSRIWRGVV